MSQHRKHRGYASQKHVADYLAQHGWPYAESTGAGRQGADVTGTVDIAVEVKARRGFNPLTALQQAEEASKGRFPFAVLRMDGQGPATVHEWVAVLRFGRLVELLREAGYGDSK